MWADEVGGRPKLIEELSLPEWKVLLKAHKIELDGHYNKKDLVKLF